ncbi:alcohol dehydrogenase [Candidatus Bathyarchaeota archaeon]|nr:MAG: alcohol dehydrogenase [Candidatus Bathyarchaeota archaeon]
MKAAYSIPGSGIVELKEVEVPKVDDGELLVKMRAGGICGTDLEKVYGKPITPPMLGHEVIGDIVESRAEGYAVGERVFAHHHVPCGKCYYCYQGDHTMCPLYHKTTIIPCGFAEYFKVPRVNVERGAVLKIPDHVTDEEAIFIEPVGCALKGVRRSGFKPGMSVSITGVGPMGAIFIKLLRTFGASFIAAADLIPFRINFAKRIGADVALNPREEDFAETCRRETDGRGVDIAILATPSVKALPTALSTLRKGGVLLIFGAPKKGERESLDFSYIFLNEISIVTSYSASELETNLALRLISSGVVKFSDLITHKFKLEKIDEAFEVAHNPHKSMKVMIVA